MLININYGVTPEGQYIPAEEVRELLKDDILQEIKETNVKRAEGLNKRKSKEALNMLISEEMGKFIFSHYEEVINKIVDEKGKFDSALAFRFLYLSTFIDYDNKLKWGECFRGKHTASMLEKDLKEVWGLGKVQTIKDKTKLINLGLLIVDEETKELSINIRYCHKGKIKNSLKGESIRVFEKAIQEIYIDSLPKEHKRLGIFIKLIPFLNTQHNILCFNTEEERAIMINPLSIQDICKIVNHTVKNARRLEGELLKTTVNEQPLLMKHTKFNSVVYSINPKLFYKGNNIEQLTALINLFYVK